MPAIREHRRPAPSRRGARRGPPRLGRRGAGPAPGPRAARPEPDRRAARPVSGERTRRVADHRRRGPLLARRAADQRHPAGDHAGRVRAAPAAPARPRPAAPGRRELGPDQLPSTVARELFRAIVAPARAGRPGHPPAVRSRRRSCSPLDDETAAPRRRALMAKPDRPATLERTRYEVARLLIDIEDRIQLRDRSDYNEAAQGEAERAGDARRSTA